jgi:hypothetical protein
VSSVFMPVFSTKPEKNLLTPTSRPDPLLRRQTKILNGIGIAFSRRQ